jgi:hypothetical protein
MVPESSMWHEASGYQYFDTLTLEDVAWEALRRNRAYQSDFQTLYPCSNFEQRQAEICSQWGLRFRSLPKAIGPKGYSLLGHRAQRA